MGGGKKKHPAWVPYLEGLLLTLGIYLAGHLLLALLIILVLTVFFAFMHGKKKYMLAVEKEEAAKADDADGGDADKQNVAKE